MYTLPSYKQFIAYIYCIHTDTLPNFYTIVTYLLCYHMDSLPSALFSLYVLFPDGRSPSEGDIPLLHQEIREADNFRKETRHKADKVKPNQQ